MSRSRRKTPVTAVTTKASDRASKQMEHRRARRAVKALDLTESEPPGAKAFGDSWNGQKDEKARFDADRHPDLMRK